ICAVDAIGSNVFGGEALFQKALQVFDRVTPAIALVLDIAVQDPESCSAPIGGQVVDGSRQRNGVGKVGDFGQELSDLHVGVDPASHASEALEEQALTQRHAAVGGLGWGRLDIELREVVPGDLAKGRAGCEANTASSSAQFLVGCDGLDKPA